MELFGKKIKKNTKMKKQLLIENLRKFVNSKPRLEFRNYGDAKCYRADVRYIGKQLAHARTLLNACERNPIAFNELDSSPHTCVKYTHGRLEITEEGVDFTPYQYWPIEYRSAVCGLLATELWRVSRESYPHFDGSERRAYFRRMFGKGLASVWFN